MSLSSDILLLLFYLMMIPIAEISCAVIIRVFYDERITINIKRILGCFFCSIAYLFISGLVENQILWILLFVLSLLFISLFFICRLGMGIIYHIEGLLCFFITSHIFLGSAYALSKLLITELTLLGVDFGEEGSDLQTSIIVYGVGIICLIVSLLLYFLFIRKKEFLKLRKMDIIMFVLYFIFSDYCSAIAATDSVANLPKNIRLSQLLFNTVLIILIPIVIIKARQTAYYNELSTRNEQFLEAELVASNIYRQSQEDTRAFRHDMNNNLALVAGLMKKKSYEEAEEYINELHGRLSSFSPRIITGDDMLDALISSKLSSIEEKGIRFTINGVVEGGFGWKPIDICAVFANLIDNAVEACERMTDTEKYIELSFRKTEHQRIVSVKNSIAEKVDCSRLGDGSHYTSKEDNSSHGFGVKNIRDTLEKNGAIMNMSCTDKEFETTIILMRAGAEV